MGSCGSRLRDSATTPPRPFRVLLGRCGDWLAQLEKKLGDAPRVSASQQPPQDHVREPRSFQHPVDCRWEQLVVPRWDVDVTGEFGWNEFGGEEVERLLEHVDLVDIKYVIEIIEADHPIPRCQDVPRGARIGRSGVHRIQMGIGPHMLSVLVLSYPWLDAGHPDKQLRTMRRLLPCLKAFLQGAQRNGDERCTVGLMMDYMCLPQKRPDGTDDRTAEDEARFKRGLSTINEWYAHKNMPVLIFDTDMPGQSSGHSNLRPHSARGWCAFELRASSLVKSSGGLWSLRAYEAGGSKSDQYSATIDATRHGLRLPPQGPDDFAADLRDGIDDGRLAFTAKADVGVVIDQYSKAFDAAFTSATELNFYGLGWHDAEVVSVAEAFAAARKRNLVLACRKIDVSANQCSEVGLLPLLESLKGMDCSVDATRMYLSEAGTVALKKAAEGAGVNIFLDDDNTYKPSGVKSSLASSIASLGLSPLKRKGD